MLILGSTAIYNGAIVFAKLIKVMSLVFLWAMIAYILLYVDPELLKDVGIKDSYLPFFTALFLVLSYTFHAFTKSLKKSLMASSAVIFLLVLSTQRVLTMLTALITGVLLVLVMVRVRSGNSLKQVN